MDQLIFYVAIILVAFAIVAAFLRREEKELPYKKRQFLLNIPERKIFEFLQTVIPINYVVFPQIVLSSIINTDTPQRSFWKYQNRINRKTIDFVVFERKYLVPVLAIEYDGRTHDRANRRSRDEFVDNTLRSSGIKILRIKHAENIDLESVASELRALLS